MTTPPNPSLELFLEVHGEDVKTVKSTLHSQIALFVLKFCERLESFKVHLVRKQNETASISCNEIDFEGFKGFHLELVEYGALSPEIKQCSLPSFRVKGHFMIHSGLCGVLRQIVKHAYDVSKDERVVALLGYKGMCLKSCAEVSAWTKFCEVELPRAIGQVVKLLSSSTNSINMPPELIRLNHHLNQPPVIHNIGKRRKQALQQIAKRSNGCPVDTAPSDVDNANLTLQGNKAEQPANKDSLEHLLRHSFAEGLDMTLTDLILFPCFHYLLESLQESISQLQSKIPHVMEWYERMRSIPRISDVTKWCGMKDVDDATYGESAEQSIRRLHWPTMPTTGSDIRTQSKKSKLKPADVGHIIQFLQNKDIVPELVEPPSDDQEMLIEWSSLPAAAHPLNGDLPAKRVERKCQQLENLVSVVMHVAHDEDVIVDFCSGGGHLGILLAYFLPDCKIVLVENKEESIERARMRVDRLGLTNITMYQSNLDYFCGRFDVGVCLHACGVATDLVLNRCLEINAAFVICPCCYGAIQNTHTVTYPRSQRFKASEISYQDYISLGHGSDQNAANIPLTKQGKLCMTYIDTDRSFKAQEHGYEVSLCSLKPLDCTPKNNLLIGWPNNASTTVTE